jgi:hypothetical protein
LAETSFPPQEEGSTAHFAERGLALQIGAATLARLIINTSRRFPYTFALALSRVGVPLPAITRLIAIHRPRVC